MTYRGKLFQNRGLFIIFSILVTFFSFSIWISSSEQGSKFLLEKVFRNFNIQFIGISGTISKEIKIERMDIFFPGFGIRFSNLKINIDWKNIIRRQLYIKSISASEMHFRNHDHEIKDKSLSSKKKTAFLNFPIDVQLNELIINQILISDNFSSARFVQALRKHYISLEGSRPFSVKEFVFPLRSLSLALKGILIVNTHKFYVDMRTMVQINFQKAILNNSSINQEKLDIYHFPELRIQSSGTYNDMRIKINTQEFKSNRIEGKILFRQLLLDSLWIKFQSQKNNSFIFMCLDKEPRKINSTNKNFLIKLITNKLDLNTFLTDSNLKTSLTSQSVLNILLNEKNFIKKMNLNSRIVPESFWNGQKLDASIKVIATFETKHLNSLNLFESLKFDENSLLNIDWIDLDLNVGLNNFHLEGNWSKENSNSLLLKICAKNLSQLWPTLSGDIEIQMNIQGFLEKYSVNLGILFVSLESSENSRLLNFFSNNTNANKKNINSLFIHGEVNKETSMVKISDLNARIDNFLLKNNGDVSIFLDKKLSDRSWKLGNLDLQLERSGIPVITFQKTCSAKDLNLYEIKFHLKDQETFCEIFHKLKTAFSRNINIESNNHELSSVTISSVLDKNFSPGDLIFNFWKDHSGFIQISSSRNGKILLKNAKLQCLKKSFEKSRNKLHARLIVHSDMGNFIDLETSFIIFPWWKQECPASSNLVQLSEFSMKSHLNDIKWLNIFLRKNIQVGGGIKTSIKSQNLEENTWKTYGTIQGNKLSVIKTDEGIELTNGWLDGSFNGDKFILNSLLFSNTHKFSFIDHKIQQWIIKHLEEEKGYTSCYGYWDFSARSGEMKLQLHQFPIVHQFEKCIVVSGKINVLIPRSSKMVVNGDLKVDTGLIDLGLTSGIRGLEHDVSFAGSNTNISPQESLFSFFEKIIINLNVGSNFKLFGLGLDAGLLGALELKFIKNSNQLSGFGILNTLPEATIEAFGQSLRIRRGQLIFQGNMDNPSLDLEALRTGEQIESGIHISGTIHKPIIGLISYPNVGDIEKLSWLMLGSSSQENIGNTELLVSIGTILLNEKHHLLKQFGITNIRSRSAPVIGSNGLLPNRTIADNLKGNNSPELTTQFLVASKNLDNGISLSIEQAIAGNETLGRISYPLSKRWTFDIKGGSRNGIALVYRTYFYD